MLKKKKKKKAKNENHLAHLAIHDKDVNICTFERHFNK